MVLVIEPIEHVDDLLLLPLHPVNGALECGEGGSQVRKNACQRFYISTGFFQSRL